MDLSEVIVRLERLEDERAIVRTMYRYAHAQYNGDREMFLDCFTEDAEVERTRHGRVVRGRAGIGAWFDMISHAPEEYHKHVLVEPVIDIDGDRAVVSSDFLFVQDCDTGPFISHFGHYTDELERCADGEWRLRRRALKTEATAPGEVAAIRGDPGSEVTP